MRVELYKQDLWKQFHAVTNEMIVTKTGRNLFPALEFRIGGLNPILYYVVSIQFDRVDSSRHKYQGGEWSANGPGELERHRRVVWHHDGAKTGADWMKRPCSFDRLKITNNMNDFDPSHIVLYSMHKYIPTVSIYVIEMVNLKAVHRLVEMFKFETATFLAVTAYQNSNVKNLKVEKNKYARGFRNERKRKSFSPELDDVVASMPAISTADFAPWCAMDYPNQFFQHYYSPNYFYH